MDASLRLAALQDQVRAAHADRVRLLPRGGGTKSWLTQPTDSRVPTRRLELGEYAGITQYEPTELVVTARAGTPLAELEAALAERGQYLPFDPPHYTVTGARATVGGTVACGLSGPGRLGAGPLRDYVLGAVLLNGRAEVLRFGGQVMKNVAGFDVSRLLTGSMGSLGAILEVSLKVLPVAPAEATLVFELDQRQAIEQVNAWCAQPLPIASSAWHLDAAGNGLLHLRLRGARAAVAAACQRLGGQRMDDDLAARWWQDLRDQSLPWFASTWPEAGGAGEALWRLALPSTTPPLALQGEVLMEWAGALRWLRTAVPAGVVRETATQAGGHATRFRGGDASSAVFTPATGPVQRIQHRIKLAFDPHEVFADVTAAP